MRKDRFVKSECWAKKIKGSYKDRHVRRERRAAKKYINEEAKRCIAGE